MEKQQQWAKDILKAIILLMKDKDYNGDFLTEGYKYTINAVIDNYSQTYYQVGRDRNISMFHRYGEYGEGIYKNILMSKNAREKLEQYKEKAEELYKKKSELIISINTIIDNNRGLFGNKLSDNPREDTIKKRIDNIINNTDGKYDGLKRDYESYKEAKIGFNKIDLSAELHGEHLTTQSQTRRILNDTLNRLKKDPALVDKIDEEIEYAFRDCKICIITKKESQTLDGEQQKYTEEEINRYLQNLKEKKYYLSPRFEADCKEFIGQNKKAYGFGSIRIQALMEKGVRFVDDQGIEKTLDVCLDYLNDGNYVTD